VGDVSQAVSFAAQLYRGQARMFYDGRVRRDPFARLDTGTGMRDPYPIYRTIREYGPLRPTPRGNWVTAHHRWSEAVLRDRRFGVRLDDVPRPADPGGFDLSFLDMNPPDHTRLRRLAQPSFSPKAMAGYRDRVERTVGDLLDRAQIRAQATAGAWARAVGRFDLVSGLAAPLPIAVITDLLGIPDANSAEFVEYGTVLGSALDGVKSLRHAARLNAANTKVARVFGDLIELRRREPRDDVISRLLAAEGDQVEPGEILPMCALLLLAGFETTVNLIGNCVLALLENRDQWEALCADPENLAPKAVQETLRYDPPVQSTARVALDPLELAGTPVRRGQRVITLLAAAGRDPEVYDRPDVFDLDRKSTTEHLAFSGGIHYCLGRPLALLEATTAIRLLAERMPGLRSAGPQRRMKTSTLRGLLSFPVQYGLITNR
jgi:cytochrome P450